MYMYGILNVNDQLTSYLSGIPGSPDAPAPPLYTTTPAPPTTPPPTCAPPYDVSYLSQGVRFGYAAETYQTFNIQQAPLAGVFSDRYNYYVNKRLPSISTNSIIFY